MAREFWLETNNGRTKRKSCDPGNNCSVVFLITAAAVIMPVSPVAVTVPPTIAVVVVITIPIASAVPAAF